MNTRILPDWVRAARGHWRNRGAERPPFALEPEAGQESVWDYPRPPVAIPDARRVQVVLGSLTLADSIRTLRVLETSHPPGFYIPKEDVDMSLLIKSERTTFCEWKGTASYFDVVTPGPKVREAAWTYEASYDELSQIDGHLSFYPYKCACYVGGEPVRSQEGLYYGGWITSDVVGPFKGGAGSSGW